MKTNEIENEMKTNNENTWSPAQYAIDSGWDFSCIEATAAKGVSDADADGLSDEQQAALLEYCQCKVEQTQINDKPRQGD